MDWGPQLEIGVAEMDNQHKRLVALVNQLHDAMKQGQGAAQVGQILQGLVDYTRTHFQAEEAMLRQRGWAGLGSHLVLHQTLLRQLGDYVDKHKAGQAVSAVDLSFFVKDWLSKHILGEDRKYAADLTK